jgi:hypothetical protein
LCTLLADGFSSLIYRNQVHTHFYTKFASLKPPTIIATYLTDKLTYGMLASKDERFIASLVIQYCPFVGSIKTFALSVYCMFSYYVDASSM